MTPKTRLSTLFVAEDWRRIYESVADVDFTALDQETIRRSVVERIKILYPETFNDFIASSEYVTMIDTLSWMAQNTNYRFDINARENIITIADRKRSVHRLAQNVSYRVKRIRPASGELKITSVATTQPLLDIDGKEIRNAVKWNDGNDTNWHDRFSTILNAALDPRSKWGRPIRRVRSLGSEVALYRANSPSPMSGSYDLQLRLSGGSVPCSVWNADLLTDGSLRELGPGQVAFHLLYRADGNGFSSPNHGFMLPIRQGQMTSYDFEVTEQSPNLVVEIPHTNVCEGEVWLYEVDNAGKAIRRWVELDSSRDLGSLGYRFNPAEKAVFEVLTRESDRIAIRFGDGQTSAMPLGRFRIWYRVANQVLQQVKAGDVKNQTITIPYVSDSRLWRMTLTADLVTEMTDGAAGDTNDDIRVKSSKMHRTQNRMVSGEDYNTYPLNESAILKLKTVNRTFAGYDHGRAMRDQTGTYGSISVTGDDGRFYKENVVNSSAMIFDRTLESVETFIERSVAEAIANENKQILYTDEFEPIRIDGTNFTVTSVVADQSRGKLNIPVGAGVLKSFGPSSLVQTIEGLRFRVDSIASETDGTGSDQVRLRTVLPDNQVNLAWYLPWLRRRLSETETSAIANRILLRKSFGLRWDVNDATWKVIKGENVNTQDEFSLDDAGDITGSASDASWFVRMEFSLGPTGEELWTMYERGRRMVFQSEHSTKFIHTNTSEIIDPVTGRFVQDTVTILPSNEAKESLPRRGARTPFAKDARSGRLGFIADGNTKQFLLGSLILDPQHIFIEQEDAIALRNDWQIIRQMGNTYILFDNNLNNGEAFVVIVDPTRVQMTPQRLDEVGDGQQYFYNFGAGRVADHNVFTFVDGKYKSPTADFRVYYTSLGARINFTTPAALDKAISVYALKNGQPVFLDLQFLGDNVTTEFNTRAEWPTAFVFKNGVLMTSGWDVDDSVAGAYKIEFDTAPTTNDNIYVKLLVDDRTFRIDNQDFTASAGQLDFNVTIAGAEQSRMLIFKNGLLAHDAVFDEETNKITLAAPAALSDKIHVIHLTFTVAESSGAEPANRITVDPDPVYLNQELRLGVFGPLLHSDGFVNPTGILVTDVDEAGGVRDDQTLFERLVIEDGVSDLVLWYLTTQDGHEVWEPISETSSPKGTFHSFKYMWAAEEEIPENTTINDGDIHYDTRSGKWLVADTETMQWNEADDQDAYKWAIGRSAIKFKWDHYASDQQLVDPSPTSIHDVSVLTEAHYKAIQSWLDNRGQFPEPETSDTLKSQFGHIARFKMMSDSLVWRPARFKVLFGDGADAALKGRFLVTRTPGSTISDNDLRLRILDAVDAYFDIKNWDFGQKFHFIELASFIVAKLSPLVNSVVVVSSSGEKFGQMFEVRCEPDELFLSTAGTTEIEIVDTLTDARLNR